MKVVTQRTHKKLFSGLRNKHYEERAVKGDQHSESACHYNITKARKRLVNTDIGKNKPLSVMQEIFRSHFYLDTGTNEQIVFK